MTAKAYVEHDLLHGVRIHMADQQHDGTVHLARFADVVMERQDEPAAMPDDPQPLRLDEDSARALYEALARYFGGSPDMAQVRKDLEHERVRVDRMIGYLIRDGEDA